MAGGGAVRDGQPVPAPRPDLSPSWTASTTACWSARPRPASRSSAATSPPTPGPLVIDMTLLGAAERIVRRAGRGAGRPGGGHGPAGRGRGRPALPRARRAPRRRGTAGGGRRRVRARRAGAEQLPARAARPGAAALARPLAGRTGPRARGHGPLGRAVGRPRLAVRGERGLGLDRRLRPARRSLRRHGSRRRAATTGSRWRCTAARTTSCCWPCRPSSLDALEDVAVVWDIAVTAVGEFAAGPPGVSLKFGDHLRRLRPGSHDHFADTVREERRDPLRGA